MTIEEFKNNLLPLKNKLFGLSLRLLTNRQEAEDVVQEIYLKIWEMRNNLSKYKSKEALMVTMTRNLCLDKIKAKSNKFSSLTFEAPSSNENTSPYFNMERKDTIRQVKEVISTLPEQQKTIIQLRDVEGYDYIEIMEMTGFDQNYIKVNLSRARKKIRETIQKIQYHEIER